MITLNGLIARAVKLWTPATGVWNAEVDFDLAVIPVLPTGPVALTIDKTVLIGTIDESATGRFGVNGRARIMGGFGGWHRNVSARQFHNDAIVLSSAVVLATAAEIGEKAIDATPVTYGVDYMRTAGPASRVLAGREWYVDHATGITTVGPRLPKVMPLDVDILSYDPQEGTAELASESVIVPGTVIIDSRFGTLTIRDVEQTFSNGKSRATVWCGTNTKPRLATLLANSAREASKAHTLKTYHYTVVSQGVDGRLTLNAVSLDAGAPNSIAVAVWLGVPGIVAKIIPGTQASVVFLDGDPAKPVVTSFKEADVIQLTIGAGASYVALSTLVDAAVETIKTAFNAHVHPTGVGPSGPPAVPLTAIPSTASVKLKSD